MIEIREEWTGVEERRKWVIKLKIRNRSSIEASF